MNPRPKQVKVSDNFILEVLFDNNEFKTYDMKRILNEPPYKSLSDENIFKTAQVSEDGMTIEWINGIDICPDELYENSF